MEAEYSTGGNGETPDCGTCVDIGGSGNTIVNDRNCKHLEVKVFWQVPFSGAL